MNNKQSSIEWLMIQLYEQGLLKGDGNKMDELLEQAKEMHRNEQKIAYESGFENSEYDQYEDCYELKPNFEDWYKQTFE